MRLEKGVFSSLNHLVVMNFTQVHLVLVVTRDCRKEYKLSHFACMHVVARSMIMDTRLDADFREAAAASAVNKSYNGFDMNSTMHECGVNRMVCCFVQLTKSAEM